ncbi:hypothetical protein [Pseudanabaena sp. FACHB-2040]|uniref:hypothetical protein n=1 Tax=Pseudanabaena sp. FACHB-2040 TaxID=2692859 RepID=UPI0016839EC1|nr:hypothetical protein [Pseudanabaena sp. FACHB-2040]MBD2260259.1 hypothetical protein [Pseudanabaena sp. FACHB-2040]
MLQIQYFLSSPLAEAARPPAPVAPIRPKRERLRLYLVGSETAIQGAINSLHLLGYAEQFEWSHVIDIPENGLLIRPDPSDVLRYLQRYRLPTQPLAQ